MRSIFGNPADEALSPISHIKNVKKVILGTAGKTPEEINIHKQTWEQLRWNWLASKLKTASDTDGILIGEKFQKILDGIGDDALKEMFNTKEISGIKDIALAGRLIQQQGMKVGPVFNSLLRFGQITGVGAAAYGGKTGVALGLLGGPTVLARFMTSSTGTRLLTTGFKTGNVASVSGQFIAGMMRTKKEMDAELKKIKKYEWKKELERAMQKQKSSLSTN